MQVLSARHRIEIVPTLLRAGHLGFATPLPARFIIMKEKDAHKISFEGLSEVLFKNKVVTCKTTDNMIHEGLCLAISKTHVNVILRKKSQYILLKNVIAIKVTNDK